MTRYVPIIKSKKAELTALAHASQKVISNIQPLIEIIPGSHPLSVAETLSRTIPANVTVAIDGRHLGDQRTQTLRDVSQYLNDFNIQNLPVISLGDQEILSTVREVISEGQGFFLRVGSADGIPPISTLESLVEKTLRTVDTSFTHVDLLLDYWEVRPDRNVDLVAAAAIEVSNWASTKNWRSVTLAAGAFPENISKLPKDTATPVPRLDELLWTRVSEALGSDHTPGFGDYTIAHPGLPQGDLRGPLPNLRYTADGVWHVYRQASPRDATNYRFQEICAKLIKADHWPSLGERFSWGDAQLARCARREGGPGGATEWRAWATSHHLAFVIDRLASLGAP